MESLFLLQPIRAFAKPIIMYDFFKNSPPIPPTQIQDDREEDDPLLNLSLSLSCNSSPPTPRLTQTTSPSSNCTVIDPEEKNNPWLRLSLSHNPSSSSSSSSCKTEKKRKRSHNQEAESGPSRPPKKKTVLLGSQESRIGARGEFVIKKTLKESDVNNLARLMLSKGAVEEHLLAHWDEDMKERLKDKEGLEVRVWDADCDVVYNMRMKIWGRNGSVVLNDRWITKFVKRRGLEKGDQIGLYWDRTDRSLVFSVLHQALIDATPISFRLPECQLCLQDFSM